MREPEDAGDVVEVAREVRPDNLQIPTPAVQQVQQAPGLRGGQVDDPQSGRGVCQDDAGVAQVRQGSAFQRFLVTKPRPGFVVSAAASDWFSPSFHKKISVPSLKSPSASPSVVSESAAPTSLPEEASVSTLSRDGILGEKGEQLSFLM